MSLTVIVLLYTIFCLLTFVVGLVACKMIDGAVRVTDLMWSLGFSLIPALNIACLGVYLIAILGRLWDKTIKWYNGVKYNRLW
jgi:hypothetical protein